MCEWATPLDTLCGCEGDLEGRDPTGVFDDDDDAETAGLDTGRDPEIAEVSGAGWAPYIDKRDRWRT